MKKSLKIAVLALLISIVLLSASGCGAAKSADQAENIAAYTDTNDGAGFENYSYSVNYDKKSAEFSQPANITAETGENKTAENLTDRKLVKNAQLDIQTKEFDKFITSAENKITEYKGYIESSQTSGSDYYRDSDNRYSEMVVRIPSEKLDEFLNMVSSMATVTSKSVSVDDITSDYIDVSSRIKALETERDALLDILKKAKSVSETLEIQSRLSEVNSSLDSSKSKLKSFDNMVSYSKITMRISEVERITESEKEGFFAETKRRLSENLYEIGQNARSFGIWFISSIPYILIFAVIIFAAVLIIKKIAKNKRKRKQNKNV